VTRRRAILVMAKRPLAGQTKTRLSPPLSPEQAAALYHCFLADTLDVVRDVAASLPGVCGYIAHAPVDADSFFARIAPDFDLVPQQGDDLGERLDTVLRHCIDAGFEQVLAINSDGPTLPAANIVAAFQRLDQPQVDAVFGPCEDGGYYLIGLSQAHSRLVRDVQMSTPYVLRDTLAVAAEEGVRTSLLPTWYDVDTVDELRRLMAELKRPGVAGARHTRDYLAQFEAADWARVDRQGST